MATAYECDHCKLTFIGEPSPVADMAIIGTPFTLRFSFGMKRPEAEEAKIRADIQENPLIRLLGKHATVDEDAVENTAADLCDPCKSKLLREAVQLAGLDLHEG